MSLESINAARWVFQLPVSSDNFFFCSFSLCFFCFFCFFGSVSESWGNGKLNERSNNGRQGSSLASSTKRTTASWSMTLRCNNQGISKGAMNRRAERERERERKRERKREREREKVGENWRQRGERLFQIVRRCGGGDEEERLGVASQTILHEHGQLAVAVRDEALVGRQRRYDVAQRRQGFIDGAGLALLIGRRSRFGQPLAAG